MKPKHPFEFVGGGMKDGVPYYNLLCPAGHEVRTFMRDSKTCQGCRELKRKEYQRKKSAEAKLMKKHGFT